MNRGYLIKVIQVSLNDETGAHVNMPSLEFKHQRDSRLEKTEQK